MSKKNITLTIVSIIAFLLYIEKHIAEYKQITYLVLNLGYII